MRKILTLLMAVMLSFTWASAQLTYSQLGDITVEQYGFISSYSSGWQGNQAYGADDFNVTAAGMDIYGATAIFNNATFEKAQVFIFADDNGKPGVAVDDGSFPGLTYVAEELAANVFQITVEFPYPLELTEGKYWFTMTGTGAWGGFDRWYVLSDASDINTKAHHKQLSGNFGPDPLAEWLIITEDDPYGGSSNGNGTYNNLAFGLIGAPDDNDLTLKKIIAPISGELTAAAEVTVTVQNVGLLTQTSFDVMYQVSTTIDGTLTLVEEATETVTETIALKEEVDYTFNKTVDLSAITNYSVKTTVVLTGDSNYDNDVNTAEVKNYGPLYIMGTDKEVTACDGIFVDDGSVTGNYSEASSDTITFYPGTEGNRVEIDFTMMEIGSGVSIFDFYDGTSTDAPLLYNFVRYSNEYPSYVKARNTDGAITVVVKVDYVDNYLGWEANISCVTADAIDFMALDMSVGDPIEFNVVGEHVDIMTVVTNAGSSTTSRNVYLVENNSIIDTLMTAEIAPGILDTLHFDWIPSLANNKVSLKVLVELDPQSTNDDNTLYDTVSVFKSGILLESFEADFTDNTTQPLPLEWISTEGTSNSYEYYKATHAEGALKIYGVDTVIMPMMQVDVVDNTLYFDGYAQGNGEAKAIQVLVSKTLVGPWDTVGVAVRPSGIYDMVSYEFDLSAYAGEPYYFAFTHLGALSYSTSYIDYVRGAKLYKANYDLMANGFAGDAFVKDNNETILDVTLVNVGGMDVMGTDYTVEIKTADSVYFTVQGIDLMVSEEATIHYAAMFATADSLELYYEIVMAGEVRVDNNMSSTVNIIVTTVYVTEGETIGNDYNTIDMHRTSAISEMIYYPSEIGSYGNLQGIEFTYKYGYDEGNDTVPAVFYIATLADSLLVDTVGWNGYPSDPSFIGTDSIAFTKVYDGMLDIQPGEGNSLYIPFDAPFAYDGIENIILMVVKDSLNVGSKYLYIDKMASEHYRYAYGYNNDEKIDTDNIVTKYDGNISKSSVPNIKWHFDNPEAPVFTSEPVVMANEFEDYTYSITTTYEGNYTIEANTLPEWLSLTDNGDKTATLTGTASVIGSFPVQLVVSDGVFSATQSFEIKVNAVPVFTSDEVIAAENGVEYMYTAEVSYSGTDMVTFTSGSENPSWMTIVDNGDNTATVSGTPDAYGDVTVTIIASGDVATEQVYTLTVDAMPMFTEISDIVIEESTDYSATLTADYEGTNTLTYSAGANNDAAITIGADGVVTGSALVVGNYMIHVVVSTGYLTDEIEYKVTAGAVPVFTSEPVDLVKVDLAYSYSVVVNYTGTDALSLSSDHASWMTFVDNGDGTAKLTGMPTEAGLFSVSILAEGEHFNSTQTFILTVEEKASVGIDPPTNLTVIPDAGARTALANWAGVADSYNVYVNGEIVTNITETTYTLVDMIDSYYVISITSLYGDVESEKTSVDFVFTDVTSTMASEINIYPNPASTYVTVSNSENSTINILDITGKLVSSTESGSELEEINISELNKGIYLIVVTNETATMSKRLVIE